MSSVEPVESSSPNARTIHKFACEDVFAAEAAPSTPRTSAAASVAALAARVNLGALAAAGEAPMLKQNRFLIRAAAGVSLHVLTIGYVGAPPNKPNRAQQVLTVASPNLLAAAEDAHTYTLSRPRDSSSPTVSPAATDSPLRRVSSSCE